MFFETSNEVTIAVDLGDDWADLTTVGYTLLEIVNGVKTTFQARTTAGVVQVSDGHGMYAVQIPATVFTAPFNGLIVWDTGTNPAQEATEELYVSNWLDLIGSQTIILTNPLVAASQAQLVKGADYLSADGRALTWTDDDSAWPSLVDATVVFEVSHQTGSFPATVIDANTVRLELTAAQTDTLEVGLHRFALMATLANTHTIPLVAGSLVVQELPG